MSPRLFLWPGVPSVSLAAASSVADLARATSPMALSFARSLIGGRKAGRHEQKGNDADRSPEEEARDTLINMGFEEADADRALGGANGDLAEAVAQLLHIENDSRDAMLVAEGSGDAPGIGAGEEVIISADTDADIAEAIRRSQEEEEERKRKEVVDREMFEAALAASLGENGDVQGTSKAVEAAGSARGMKKDADQELLDLVDKPAEAGTARTPELSAMPPTAPARPSPDDVLPPVATPPMSRSAAVSSLRGFGSDREIDDMLGWPPHLQHGGRNSGSRAGSAAGGARAGGSRGGVGSRSGRKDRSGVSHSGSHGHARSSSSSALRSGPPGQPWHHMHSGREQFSHEASQDPFWRPFPESNVESLRRPGGSPPMEGLPSAHGLDNPRVSTPSNEDVVGLADLEGWSTTTVMRPCLLPSLKAPPISSSHLSGSRPITRPNSTTRANSLSGSSSAPLLAASSAILSTSTRRKPDVDPWGR